MVKRLGTLGNQAFVADLKVSLSVSRRVLDEHGYIPDQYGREAPRRPTQ